jgi:hypothetical protein
MRYATLTAFLYVAVLCGGCAGTRTEGSIPDVLAPGAQVSNWCARTSSSRKGRSARQTGGLLFTDLRGSRIYYLDTRGAPFRSIRDQTNETNGLALTRNGELIAAEAGAKRISISISSSGVAARELTRGDEPNRSWPSMI